MSYAERSCLQRVTSGGRSLHKARSRVPVLVSRTRWRSCGSWPAHTTDQRGSWMLTGIRRSRLQAQFPFKVADTHGLTAPAHWGDERAKAGCDDRGKPGRNIVAPGSFAAKSGRQQRVAAPSAGVHSAPTPGPPTPAVLRCTRQEFNQIAPPRVVFLRPPGLRDIPATPSYGGSHGPRPRTDAST